MVKSTVYSTVLQWLSTRIAHPPSFELIDSKITDESLIKYLKL